MVEDWDKIVVIPERENKEFRRAMEAEVSTVFSIFSSEYKNLTGIDITQCEMDLSIFKQCLALLPWLLLQFTKFHFSLGSGSKHQ